MNKQEILQALDLPFPCDFPMLAILCRDPDVLEAVLSLAINQGKKSGMTEVSSNYNQALRGYTAVSIVN
jgi:hypothetical protein